MIICDSYVLQNPCFFSSLPGVLIPMVLATRHDKATAATGFGLQKQPKVGGLIIFSTCVELLLFNLVHNNRNYVIEHDRA